VVITHIPSACSISLTILVLLNGISIFVAILHPKASYKIGLWLFGFSFYCVLIEIEIMIAFCSLLKNTDQYQDNFVQYLLDNEGNAHCKWIEEKLRFNSVEDAMSIIKRYIDDRCYWPSWYLRIMIGVWVIGFLLVFSFWRTERKINFASSTPLLVNGMN
jgi:hypothetical protein